MGKASRGKRERPATAEPAPDRAPAPVTVAGRAPWPDWSLVAIVTAAALFRVAYLLQYQAQSVFFGSPLLDAAVYDAWARRIAAGAWLPAESFYLPPAYPYALGLLYAVVGPSLPAVYGVQLVLGLVNIVLIHRLAGLAFGRRAATAAAALAALYASFPFFETKPLSAVLALTLLLAGVLALARAPARPSAWRWALAGMLLGLTSLTRTETLLLAPFVALWVWRWSASASRARALALVAAAWAATILPVAIHNVRSGGGSTLISSQGGLAFYQGNNPRARGLMVFLQEEGFSGMPERQAEEEKAIAEKAAGRPLTRAEVSSYWLHRGLTFIAQNPGAFLLLLGQKALRFIGSYEYSMEYMLPVERERVWLLWLPFVPFGLLVGLAVPTLVRVLRPGVRALEGAPAESPAAWLLVCVLAANVLTVLVFYVSSRYRLASVPPLIAFAGATVVALADGARAGRRPAVFATVLVVAGVLLVAQLERDAGTIHQEANTHFNTGNAWRDRGDYTRAAAEYRRATQMDPSRYVYFFSLGIALRELGQTAAAADAYGAAAVRRPDFFPAHAWQGLMLEALGDWRGARASYERAERLNPGDFEVQLRLGRAAARLGDRDAAIRHLDKALALQPDSDLARAERSQL
jgi:tetratricopeptide (TPR) repeat protein